MSGELSTAEAELICGLERDATSDALVRDEELLVGEARKLGIRAFARVAAYWEQLADPDGIERSAEECRTRREVQLGAGFAGIWHGTMTLDPISGTIVADELGRLERELFDADRAEAIKRLGDEPRYGELSRSSAQRRADALVEMARRSAAMTPDRRRPSPLFNVYVGYETLHGRIVELANGIVVTPGSLVSYLEGAMITRAVFSPSGRVEVSETARLFTGATRRAIELRDRRCTHEFCDEAAENCQGDHIEPFSTGGLTTQENGRLLCGFHNRVRNARPPPAA